MKLSVFCRKNRSWAVPHSKCAPIPATSAFLSLGIAALEHDGFSGLEAVIRCEAHERLP